MKCSHGQILFHNNCQLHKDKEDNMTFTRIRGFKLRHKNVNQGDALIILNTFN